MCHRCSYSFFLPREDAEAADDQTNRNVTLHENACCKAPSTAAAVECRVVGEEIRQAAAYLGERTPNIDTASVDRNTHARTFSLMETQRWGATCFYRKQQSNSNLRRVKSVIVTNADI